MDKDNDRLPNLAMDVKDAPARVATGGGTPAIPDVTRDFRHRSRDIETCLWLSRALSGGRPPMTEGCMVGVGRR